MNCLVHSFKPHALHKTAVLFGNRAYKTRHGVRRKFHSEVDRRPRSALREKSSEVSLFSTDISSDKIFYFNKSFTEMITPKQTQCLLTLALDLFLLVIRGLQSIAATLRFSYHILILS